ncbi:MAG: trigger factor [Candidatus Schekmanbacteria bacterium]|nr:trigger factor [Candidatus Schekmanbacteria bacterium]
MPAVETPHATPDIASGSDAPTAVALTVLPAAHPGSCYTRIAVDISGERVAAAVEEQYQTLRKQAHVPGFRPGKTPRQVLTKRYADYVKGRVTELLLASEVVPAIDKLNLESVAMDALELASYSETGPMRLEVTLQTVPRLTPSGYKGLSLTRKERPLTDDDVAAELKELQERYTSFSPFTDREVQEKDLVVLDIDAYHVAAVDPSLAPIPTTPMGPAIAGLSGKDVPYRVGVDALLQHIDFKNRLTGMLPGQTAGFLALPEEPQRSSLWPTSGTVQFVVTIKEAKAPEAPAIDDELAATAGDYDTLQELTAAIRERLARRFAEESREATFEQAAALIVAANPIDVPPELVRRQLAELFGSYFGVNPDALPVDPAKVPAETRKYAEDSLRRAILLDLIARVEGITATDEEVDSLAHQPVPEEERAAHHAHGPTAADVVDASDKAQRQSLERRIRHLKTLGLIVDYAVFA